MSIKDIMVICDAGEANDYRVETTLLLAKVFNSHVIGVHLTPYPITTESSSGFVKAMDYFSSGFLKAADYLSSNQIELAKATAESLKAKFESKATEHDVPHEWKYIDGIDVQFIIDNARYADFVVLPQGYSQIGIEYTQRIDDYLSIYMGRPVIITPDIKKVFNFPQRIMIAWDESQEATRAVHDSLPFLEYAENVQITCVSQNIKQEKSNIIYSDDLRKHLSHHDIDAEVIYVDELAEGIGQTILQSAIEYDADLIVMGAYGQARLKEIVVGGATRHLLKKTTVPLFLSH